MDNGALEKIHYAKYSPYSPSNCSTSLSLHSIAEPKELERRTLSVEGPMKSLWKLRLSTTRYPSYGAIHENGITKWDSIFQLDAFNIV